MAVECWPYGHNTRNGDCDQTIADDNHETMELAGWGWVWARDDGSCSGEGPFMACPHHRDDISDEQRQAILSRLARKGA